MERQKEEPSTANGHEESPWKKSKPTQRKRSLKGDYVLQEERKTRPRRGKKAEPSGEDGLCCLATMILEGKNVVFLTGAGLSVASGIPPFRGRDDAVWAQSVQAWGTRQKFQEDPLAWYNKFWLEHFDETKAEGYLPNKGHQSIAEICKIFPMVKVMTQNIDRLHLHSSGQVPEDQLIEVHGFSGGFKCYTSSCKYSSESVHFESLKNKIRKKKKSGKAFLKSEEDLPKCPDCESIMVPNCLLFDEEYTDHHSYQFEKAKTWLRSADAIVFVGTSFAVQITQLAFSSAASKSAVVFNFNLIDNVPSQHYTRLHIFPVNGPCEETLVQLASKVSSS